MAKRRPKLDSTLLTRSRNYFGGLLTVVFMLIRVGEQVQAEFFTTGIQKLFGLELHNQRSSGQVETTTGFNLSKRSRKYLGNGSNCSSNRHYRSRRSAGGRSGRNIYLRNFNVLACSTTTSGAMVKRMVQEDSAHQIGLKPTLHAVLIVVESGDRRGGKSWRNFSSAEIWECFWL
jgi:hypothetical protein